MKQRTVINLLMKDEKARSKAMKIAVVTQGVTSVAIEGADRDILVVIGNGVDAANLTKSLRDKVGYATIVSVQQLEGTRYEEEQEHGMSYGPSYNNFKTNYPTTLSFNYGYDQYPQNYPVNTTYRMVYDHDSPGCSVM